MIDAILRDLRQPEYIHVLINPLPVYGLAIAVLGLVIAFFLQGKVGGHDDLHDLAAVPRERDGES